MLVLLDFDYIYKRAVILASEIWFMLRLLLFRKYATVNCKLWAVIERCYINIQMLHMHTYLHTQMLKGTYITIDNLNTLHNTMQLSLDITLLRVKFRSALTRLGGADAVILQSNCVRRTCSRSLYGSRLG